MKAFGLLPIGADRFIEKVRVAIIPRYARIVGVDQHDVELEASPIVVGDVLDFWSLYAKARQRVL